MTKIRMGFRWFGEQDDPISLSQIKQIPQTKQVVGALFDVPVGEVWPTTKINKLKDTIEAEGLKFEVVESVNIHDDIKIGLPTRDQYIENYKETIKNLAAAGVKVICYNFMPVFDWLRTELHYQLADGSNVMMYEEGKLPQNPEALLDQMNSGSRGFSLPGWEPERLGALKNLFAAYQEVDEDKLVANLKYFLDAIMPTCEQYDVKMAIHPDDPPKSLFNLPRIFKNRDDMFRIANLNPSKHNGFTICTGSLGENQANDIPAIIREFVPMGKVPFLHLRNIKFFNSQNDFHESAHPTSEGSLDMYEIMKAVVDSGFDGYVRPDHGRNIWDEDGRPGYGLYDRALGITYLLGLFEAISKK